MRVAISGIPSSQMRKIIGKSVELSTLYRETLPRLQNENNLRHEIGRIQNTGNYLIGEGARYGLLGNDVQYIPTRWLLDADSAQWIDHINRNFDYFVYCTANLFHIGNNPADEARLLEQLTVPVLMMSAGIQKQSDFSDTVPAHFVRLIEVLKQKKIHVFTRGEPTTKFLRAQGVGYVEPVGCPSLFAFPDNVRTALKELKNFRWQETTKILHSGYLGSVKDTVYDVNALTGAGAKAGYAVQDEPLLFNYKFEAPENTILYNDAAGKITSPVTFPGSDELTAKLDQYVFFSPNRWRAVASQFDFALARRFHGGLIAAQGGVPTHWIAVDDRTTEMLEFAGLPHATARQWNSASDKRAELSRMITGFNLEQSLRTYNTRLERFRSLLKELGLRK